MQLNTVKKNFGLQEKSVFNVFFFFSFAISRGSNLRQLFVFPHPLQSLVFSSTNIRTLVQLNALATVRRLDSLVIESEGNPVTRLLLWRPYVIFRLAHFTLKRVNGVEVRNQFQAFWRILPNSRE